MVADLGVGHDHAALETRALADLGAGANDDVGANKGGGVDLGSGVHEDVAAVHPLVLRGVGKIRRALRGEVGEVKAGTCCQRSSQSSQESYEPEMKSLGWPTSIQKPWRSKAWSCWSAAIAGKISFSIEVGRSCCQLVQGQQS